MRVDLVSKGILSWIGFIILCMFIVLIQQVGQVKEHSKFFHIGPGNDLYLFGVAINNWLKYMIVVFYTMISTGVRTLQQEIIMPWIIQNVQNTKQKESYTLQYGYFIVITDVIFRWVDWIMYLNILLTQIDFLLIEMIGNIGLAMYTTKVYLQPEVSIKEVLIQLRNYIIE